MGATKIIAIADKIVENRGEPLSEIWWRGKQWAGTAYGIECLDGAYPIEKSRLLEEPGYSWPQHMSEKRWVDIDEFTTAWLVGLVLHDYGPQLRAINFRNIFAKLFRKPKIRASGVWLECEECGEQYAASFEAQCPRCGKINIANNMIYKLVPIQ